MPNLGIVFLVLLTLCPGEVALGRGRRNRYWGRSQRQYQPQSSFQNPAPSSQVAAPRSSHEADSAPSTSRSRSTGRYTYDTEESPQREFVPAYPGSQIGRIRWGKGPLSKEIYFNDSSRGPVFVSPTPEGRFTDRVGKRLPLKADDFLFLQKQGQELQKLGLVPPGSPLAKHIQNNRNIRMMNVLPDWVRDEIKRNPFITLAADFPWDKPPGPPDADGNLPSKDRERTRLAVSQFVHLMAAAIAPSPEFSPEKIDQKNKAIFEKFASGEIHDGQFAKEMVGLRDDLHREFLKYFDKGKDALVAASLQNGWAPGEMDEQFKKIEKIADMVARDPAYMDMYLE